MAEVEVQRLDEREFTATYFALRVGLVASAVLVLMAPAAAALFGSGLPPSISDSFHTEARTVFVLGLTAGAALLVVIRGDTLTEQTLLNVAGALGLVVAGVSCVPKDDRGDPVAFDPEVVAFNRFALWALLLLAVAVWLVGRLLPDELKGDGWHVRGRYRLALRSLYPVLFAIALVGFLAAPDALARHAHGPAAVLMFVLLGLVALLRTAPGTALLERWGDTPVEASLSRRRRVVEPTPTRRAYDVVYAAVGAGMVGVVLLALALWWAGAGPRLVLGVEVALLVLFGVFWAVQTREAWVGRRGAALLSGR